MTYKYCIVPKCTNTTARTSEKLFFRVPSDAKIRKKWCKVMKRDDKTPLSAKTSLYCCEDHFDVSFYLCAYCLLIDLFCMEFGMASLVSKVTY